MRQKSEWLMDIQVDASTDFESLQRDSVVPGRLSRYKGNLPDRIRSTVTKYNRMTVEIQIVNAKSDSEGHTICKAWLVNDRLGFTEHVRVQFRNGQTIARVIEHKGI